MTTYERPGPERPGPDYPPEWDDEPDVRLEPEHEWCDDCGAPLSPAPEEQTSGLCPLCLWGVGQ
jgi:hypothetical protein